MTWSEADLGYPEGSDCVVSQLLSVDHRDGDVIQTKTARLRPVLVALHLQTPVT